MKNKYIWITIPNCCHFKELKHIAKSAEEKNMNEELWFEMDESEEAESFVRDMKKWIVDNYPHKERAIWLNDEWVDEVK